MIHQTIINNNNAPRVSDPNLRVGVGVTVPGSVQFAPLPGAILRIRPAWRGMSYFVFGDEIVIIDPRTRRIVAVIPA